MTTNHTMNYLVTGVRCILDDPSLREEHVLGYVVSEEAAEAIAEEFSSFYQAMYIHKISSCTKIR